MYTLKSIAKRGSALGMAVALFAATVIPSAAVFADALNPLTDRSLTLSSGSPGWAYTDGSGNSTYAPPNSGANGQKTGNTFGFKVSSSATVKAFSFQYCTTSAGDCMGPGNNACETGTTGGGDCVRKNNAQGLLMNPKTSDLEVVAPSASEATFGTYVTNTNAGTNPNGTVSSVPAPGASGSNYMVYYNNGGTWTASTGWTMGTVENQTYNGAAGIEGDGKSTAKNNYITLTKAAGQAFTAGQDIRVVFFGTDSNYITNPGSDAFFVKINTYSDETLTSGIPDQGAIVDGGVTVANVMNQSIQITTKVLETMDFSVGTVDPYTLAATGSAGSQLETAYPGHNLHGPCDPILKGMNPTDPVNTLQLGNETGEFSLETDDTYSTHSYWRLSSNSSAGATVYYSGVTLSNTVGDQINAIGPTAAAPIVGSEQFGLALANATTGYVDTTPADGFDDDGLAYPVNYAVERTGPNVFENGADNATNGVHSSVTDNGISNLDANASWHSPQLYPLAAGAQYDAGAGVVNSEYGTINTQFAFDTTSNTIPVPFATESNQVVDCVTGKMRYIANIAATTPAGIYTTKINYIAAPQY